MNSPRIHSSLPQDLRGFQRDRDAIAMRYHPRRIVRWRSGRGHGGAVAVAARRARQLADALHLLSHRAAAVTSVGIKLNAYRVRIEVMEIDLNIKDMLPAFSLHLHFTKA